MNVVERFIEAYHSIIKRRVPPNYSGAIVSLARRLPTLADDIDADPALLHRMAEIMDKTRHLTNLPRMLGLQRHPDLLNAKGRDQICKLLNKIIYRMDSHGQHGLSNSASQHHTKTQDKARASAVKVVAAARGVPAPITSEESVRSTALVEHFREIATEPTFVAFSLPRAHVSGLKRISEAMMLPYSYKLPTQLCYQHSYVVAKLQLWHQRQYRRSNHTPCHLDRLLPPI